ncbi:CTP synthase [Bifidobacterium sp. DSM 109958]|uniref:CTP synthase n=1 Tax=Bifidobacterium moraviense TaxID=2675323 RepID=A0A7Y0F0J1_9BIFI|nr:hypothetical protein [Bifidobacterium sp. DSM 109958]NMM99613.1 CTP synthase [Bifidobacterium sp. DSM 109958]
MTAADWRLAGRDGYRAAMRRNRRIEELLDAAQRERRCAFARSSADQSALSLRVSKDVLIRPFRGLYSRREYWSGLTPADRTLHMARSLSLVHPDWTFAGITAAAIHGFEHSFRLHDGTVCIASPRGGQRSDHARLRRIYMSRVSPMTVEGVRVTDPLRTLVDCANAYPFGDVLAMFDSAMRRGIPVGDVLPLCRELRMDTGNVAPLCAHADGLAENGGESAVRALMIVNGFVTPQLQRRFGNPLNPECPYRVDFAWTRTDGTIAVAEFDGMDKYVTPQGRSRGNIRAAVFAERRREDHLREQGVTVIVRLEFEDILYPERLVRKLMDAGVPRIR